MPARAASPGTRPAGRTILLVSAHFPPSMEVGAARWEGFTPFLIQAGWRLSVLSERAPGGVTVDETRVASLGPQVAIASVPRRDPPWRRRVLRIVALLRGRPFAEPDATEVAVVSETLDGGWTSSIHPRTLFESAIRASRSRRWIASVVEESARLLAQHPVALVISSGPPHDAHVAASRIARCHGVPHVVDLRDPWIGNPADTVSHSALVASPTAAPVESDVLSHAAGVLSNTPAAAEQLLARLPQLRGRVHVVLNGSDRAPRPPRVLCEDEPFLIVHTGTLYLDRDPRPFLRAVAGARERLGALGQRVRVVFMGRRAEVAGRTLSDWAASLGIGDCFEERPFGTREAAAQLMDSAAMLVAFQGATPAQVPAKVYEYVSNAATLLALTDPASATASILAGSSAIIAAIDDERSIRDRIVRAVTEASSGMPLQAVDSNGRFARSAQAEILLRVLADVTGQAHTGR